MAKNLITKILESHLVDGKLVPGGEIGIRIDQTLTQDATGTMAFLQFEAMGIPRVKTELSVSYVDHNMAMNGPENHNDHLYLQSVATKVGAHHSRPGNGICHQVHLERFGVPGKTLIGSDSHTPTNGGIGMIAIGAGGLDVAVAMGGGAFYIPVPKVIGIKLTGALHHPVAAKDVIFRVLSILTTKGNVGCIIEYHGEGVKSLGVPERSTITNMGAEVGVTCSVFPSDDVTLSYMKAQGRGRKWKALSADEGAGYDRITKKLKAEDAADKAVLENIKKYAKNVEVSGPDASGVLSVSFDLIEINLDELEPLAACPSSPDNIKTVRDLAGTKVDQVLVGSCTNSSYHDLMTVASMLEGRYVNPNVEFGVAPGSRQVFNTIARNGALAHFINSGARVLESACGACIGQGQSPGDKKVSARTFNRNFKGRSGTKDDFVYLVSPETAVACAITGEFTDPRDLPAKIGKEWETIVYPKKFVVDDGMILPPIPEEAAGAAEIIRGSTIGAPPPCETFPHDIHGIVTIKVGDKITTDHISPAGTWLKYRSNIPKYAEAVFDIFSETGKPKFWERTLKVKESGKQAIIVGGDSYGQGSSREHAAICPLFLGIRVVIAKAFERIHFANLINFGILPLVFVNTADYDAIGGQLAGNGDELAIEDVNGQIARAKDNGGIITVKNVTQGTTFQTKLNISERQRVLLLAGGLLTYTKSHGAGKKAMAPA
jgi:aconitate hydratase